MVSGTIDAVNPEQKGTKVSAHYELTVGAGKTATIWLRLTNVAPAAMGEPFGNQFGEIVQTSPSGSGRVLPVDHSRRR